MIKYSIWFLAALVWFAQVSAQSVTVQKVPDNGLQPRLIEGTDGAIHLLYFKKRLDRPDAREGNLYYRSYNQQTQQFGLPVKVSSEAFPLQTVSISRASVAIDGKGRVHAIWYLPKKNQYFYTRSNEERNKFDDQQAMIMENFIGLDAGADIAAHGDTITITWGAGDLSREYERTVFGRTSIDGGETFGPEQQFGNPDIGACACCSLAVDFLNEDDIAVAYRAALGGIGRDMQLLTLEDVGTGPSNAFYREVSELQKWEASFCPLSTNDMARSNGSLWLVFETESRIVLTNLNSEELPRLVGDPYSETRQKNPAVAINHAEQRLIVWAEAISHTRGGRLNMRLFDEQDKELVLPPLAETQLQNFTFPAAASLRDGNFLVLY